MTEDKIPHWRDGKNARIEARDKASAEEAAKSKESSELNNPTHWRYNKSKGIKHGTTTAKDIGLKPAEKKEKKPSKEEIAKSNISTSPEKTAEPKDIKFTKETAKALNRDDQEDVLVKRMVKFTSKDKEDDLIKKIIKSNPKV